MSVNRLFGLELSLKIFFGLFEVEKSTSGMRSLLKTAEFLSCFALKKL